MLSGFGIATFQNTYPHEYIVYFHSPPLSDLGLVRVADGVSVESRKIQQRKRTEMRELNRHRWIANARQMRNEEITKRATKSQSASNSDRNSHTLTSAYINAFSRTANIRVAFLTGRARPRIRLRCDRQLVFTFGFTRAQR